MSYGAESKLGTFTFNTTAAIATLALAHPATPQKLHCLQLLAELSPLFNSIKRRAIIDFNGIGESYPAVITPVFVLKLLLHHIRLQMNNPR